MAQLLQNRCINIAYCVNAILKRLCKYVVTWAEVRLCGLPRLASVSCEGQILTSNSEVIALVVPAAEDTLERVLEGDGVDARAGVA